MTVKKKAFQDYAILIDGSSFVYRAHFAIKGYLSTSRGFPTKALFGVTQMLHRILKDFDPKIIVWFADEKGPTFRHHVYAEYKAQRPEMPDELKVQLPYIKKIVEALGIPFVSCPGYEADDLIATFVQEFPVKAIIVAPDKDLYALVSERIILYDPVRETFLDQKEFLNKFGFPPEKFPDFRALVGDPSDNIKGVPGVGEKTAKELIASYGSLEKIYENLSRINTLKLRHALEKYKDLVFENRNLMRLKGDAKLSSYDLSYYNRKQEDLITLRSLFKELEFKKFLKDFAFPSEELNYTEEPITFNRLKVLPKESKIGIDLSFASKELKENSSVNLFSKVGNFKLYLSPSDDSCFEIELSPEALSSLCERELIFFDIKHTLHQIKNNQNLEISFNYIQNFSDVKLLSYLLDPSKRSYELSDLTFHYLDVSLLESDLPCKRAVAIRRLGKVLQDEISKEGLSQWLKEVETPLSYVLFVMEDLGIGVDLPYVRELHLEYSSRLKEIEEKLFELSGFRFNPRSPQEIGRILFEKLKLPKLKTTPKGEHPSTDVEVLEELRHYHPMVEYLIQYRNLYKLKSTYVDVLLKLTNPIDRRLRTVFNQTGTTTGRLSSQNPNLQNIPIKGEEGIKIRRAFMAEDGWYLCSLDYSQIELRILAHFSQDENLLSAFQEEVDIHARTACEVFGVKLQAVTQEMRRVAKVINFGIAYGMSAYGLAKELNIDQHSANLYIKRYFERYPGVKAYMEEITQFAKEKGFVQTISKRKRYLPEVFSPNKSVKELAGRMAVNTPIQGSAADLIKASMVALFREFKKRGLKSRILLQVHDELVLEIPEDEIDQIKELSVRVMENPFPLLNLPIKFSVPIKVNFSLGKTWADCK